MSAITDFRNGGQGAVEAEVVTRPELPRRAEDGLDELRALVRSYSKRAVTRLAELMECEDRQSIVALGACRVILEMAMAADGDTEDLSKLSDEQLMARRARTS